jgi:tetratricopeptide (TPR) repeat protein/energy-coupling factor transporter ATP-binding protein EcfA2
MADETQRNPFPGLRSFETDEEYLFFGREGLSQEILRRLRENRFLAIIGTSGSGKSSLIRAGLLPYLYGGFMVGRGSHWRTAIFRPGSDPMGNLARTLNAPAVLGPADASEEEAARNAVLLEVTLRHSGLGLIEAVQLAGLSDRDNVLVIIDQFEELFRFADASGGSRPQNDAAAFVRLLLEATRQSAVPIYIVLTMRSEFIGDCARFRDLPEAVTASPYLIPWMTREQRRAAIEEPVRVAQARISQRLVTRILNDGGENPDQLPTMQHALMRTWDYWRAHHQEGEPIDLEHYLAIGGIADALSRHADLTYDDVPNDRLRLVAKRMFQALTEKLSDNRDVRRPTTIAKIAEETDFPVDEVIAVVEHFRKTACSFLMPPPGSKLEKNSVVDISHESLIRGWHRLAGWVREECESAGFYRRLAEWAAGHAQGKAALWQDPDLQNALDWRAKEQPNEAWAQRYHPGFAQAMAFLDQSCKAAETKRQAEEQRKVEEERRRADELRRTRTHLKVVGFVCIVALSMLAGAIYYNQKYRKETETAHALAVASRESESRTLEVTRETLIELYKLPKSIKQSADVQNLNESLLQKASSVSAQILSEDKTNSDARMLATISAALLEKLHAEQVGDDDKKHRRLHEECEHNIQVAIDLTQHSQQHLDVVMGAMQLASSSETLQMEGDHERARDLALQAISNLQETWGHASWNDELIWSLSEWSYSIASGVLALESSPIFRSLRNPKILRLLRSPSVRRSLRDSRIPDLLADDEDHGISLLQLGRRDKAASEAARNRNETGQRGAASRVSLLGHLRKVAQLEQEMKMPEKALESYGAGTQLARKIIAEGEPSEELLESAFWLFAGQGLAYSEAEKFDQARTSMDEAKLLQTRFPPGSVRGEFDHMAILSFLGTLRRRKSAKIDGNPELVNTEFKTALADDKKSLELAQDYPGYKNPAERTGLLVFLQENVIRDCVGLKDYQSVDRSFQAMLRTLESAYHSNTSEYDDQLSSVYSRTEHVFQDAGDYSGARSWVDRQIKAVSQRISSAVSAAQKNQRRSLLSQAYGQRSWLDLFMGDFEQAVSDAEQGLKLDSGQLWILTNKAHGLLFSGKFDKAMQIYQNNLRKRLNEKQTFGEAVQDDFKEFRQKPHPKMNLAYLAEIESRITDLKAQTPAELH